VIYDFMIRR